MVAESKLKILYVSDSLGTPIHARGIFNYSVSLVEILKKIGADVTLVVEQAPGFGLSPRIKRTFRKHSAAAISSSQLAEVYRYFNDTIFSFNWRYQTRWFRFLAEKVPPLARLAQKIEELFLADRGLIVENRLNAVDFVPIKGEHLRLFDRFLLLNRFYSSSMSRAANGMEPIAIDSAGYDLVVIDTPHFVRVHGIDRSRVLTVVHDLIPLRDPTMGPDWRQLFFKKVEAAVASLTNLIFVSEYTRNTFHLHFPDARQGRKETIIYPPIRANLMKEGGIEKTGEQAEYLRKFAARNAAEVAKRKRAAIWEERKLMGFDEKSVPPYQPEGLDYFPTWNPSLPYFATALSDEPRKNISLLVKAFSKLTSVANMVVIGEIDGNKYIGHEPENYPNLHFTGYLPEADKISIIQHSAGVIFPSFSEGFGIPLVEGAVLGVPVLCSDIPVFREIAGDNATYFDPYESASLVAAVESVLASPETCAEAAASLKEEVSKRFSQDAMAERLGALVAELGIASDLKFAGSNDRVSWQSDRNRVGHE